MSEFIERLVATPARWASGSGPDVQVVHSTRVRLARNVAEIPFPHKADPGYLEKQKEQARSLSESVDLLQGIDVVDLDRLGPLECEVLVERHLISRDHARGHGRLLMVDVGENIAIMVNEEDHYRFQVLRSGLDVFEAWRILRQIERAAGKSVNFAYDDELGYLTACPTNVGTGLRVSTLCHLPGLAMTGELAEVMDAAGRIGIVVRGFYGEGTEALGNFFQFANRTSLGQGEEEIINDLETWVRQIIDREVTAREKLLNAERIKLEDKVFRAYGILQSARTMSAEEMMNLLSLLRLGLDVGLISSPDLGRLNMIQLASQPAHLQRNEGKALSPVERDHARAAFIRWILTQDSN